MDLSRFLPRSCIDQSARTRYFDSAIRITHFKFTTQPFAERVVAEALWQNDRMRQGLARLRYLAAQATVGLVIGASGVGKSALIKRFMHELPRPQHEPVYLHLTHQPSAGLLKLLVTKLGEVPRRGKDRLVQQILDKQAGGTEKLFESSVKELIHDYSGGVPRQINNLATPCLLGAMAENANRANEAILRQTMNEFQLP